MVIAFRHDVTSVCAYMPMLRFSWSNFYARKLKFGILPALSLQLYARFAPGPCPGVGLGVKMYTNI